MVKEVLPDIPDEDDLPENDGDDADDDSGYWDMKSQKLYFHHADTCAYNKRPFLLVGNECSLKSYTLLVGNNSYNFSTFLWELVNRANSLVIASSINTFTQHCTVITIMASRSLVV